MNNNDEGLSVWRLVMLTLGTVRWIVLPAIVSFMVTLIHPYWDWRHCS